MANRTIAKPPPSPPPEGSCKLCRQLVNEEERECVALGVCGRHLNKLKSLEQKLVRWAMQSCADVNPLHSLSSPNTVGWCEGVFQDLQLLDLLVALLLLHGCDPEQLGPGKTTPLEDAVVHFIVAFCDLPHDDDDEMSRVDTKDLKVGLQNLARILAMRCRSLGRGFASESFEEINGVLADEAEAELARLNGHGEGVCRKRGNKRLEEAIEGMMIKRSGSGKTHELLAAMSFRPVTDSCTDVDSDDSEFL